MPNQRLNAHLQDHLPTIVDLADLTFCPTLMQDTRFTCSELGTRRDNYSTQINLSLLTLRFRGSSGPIRTYPYSTMLVESLIMQDGWLLDADHYPMASRSCYIANHWLGDNGDTQGRIQHLRRKELIACIHAEVQFT